MIHLSFTGACAELVLDRPPVNAFDRDQLERFANALLRLRAQPDVRLLIVRGAGDHFSAGADIELLESGIHGPSDVPDLAQFASAMQDLWSEVEALNLPTLAALRGAATGGGLELALACDLRVAAYSARIGLPEAQLGLLPGAGGTQRLTRVSGRGRALRLMLTAQLVDGREAERLAMVEWAVPDDKFDAQVNAIASTIIDQSGPALTEIKRCVSLAGGPEGYAAEIEATRRLYATDDAVDRIRAFVEAKGKRS